MNQIEYQRILIHFLLIIFSSFLQLLRFRSLPPTSVLAYECPDAHNCSPRTTIFCISASIQIKEEGDLTIEERGGMGMGMSIGGGG